MAEAEDNLRVLEEALALSPENVTLRCHVASLCLKRGLHDDAERLYRAGLEMTPNSEALKFGLARAFHAGGKHAAALVIVEELIERADAEAAVFLLGARLFMRDGNIPRAASAYRKAIDLDPNLADAALAEALGVEEAEDDGEVDAEGRVRMRAGSGDEKLSVEIEKPDMSFNDVGGMDGLKEQIRLKIIEPLRQPEIYKAYGKKIGGGILMFGPPGCGKTHLARATAGQVSASFMAIGIHDVLDMWLGNSQQKLHALFEHARKNTPCVLFFDEVDALGASRSQQSMGAARHVINQFLSELDGVKASNEGVLILGATNAPWHLDAAFRRPGRFDRVIFVPPPDEKGRASILRVLLKGKPVADVDADAVAAKTKEFSGADLKHVVDSAIEVKLDEALKTGVPQPLTTKDLLRAAKATKPTTREWFSTARNYALYANEVGAYDEVLAYLKIKQ